MHCTLCATICFSYARKPDYTRVQRPEIDGPLGTGQWNEVGVPIQRAASYATGIMQTKTVAIIALVIAVVGGLLYARFERRGTGPQPWNTGVLTATYVNTQLRQIDSGNASLVLYYELRNNTDSDYRLADAPGFVVMRRLHSDGSLSSQENVRLSYPTFLPGRQRARVALEIRHAFTWPAEKDPAFQDKFREFVNQRLSDVDEFVLFDQTDRAQIEFPKAWQELQLASAAPRVLKAQ
jgi:hypothetical protein